MEAESVVRDAGRESAGVDFVDLVTDCEALHRFHYDDLFGGEVAVPILYEPL